MSLLKKTLLVVVSTVIVSMVSLYFASRLTLLQGYEKIEQDLKSPLITIRGFLGLLERDALSGQMIA